MTTLRSARATAAFVGTDLVARAIGVAAARRVDVFNAVVVTNWVTLVVTTPVIAIRVTALVALGSVA